MVSTNVPGITFGDKGVQIPATQDVLTGVQADINAAFGGGLNPALETPQGQLASSQAAVIDEANATFQHFANMVDPARAAGRMQDAIGRIYFIERKPAEPTVVQALCTGGAGVLIPAGALAKAKDGNIYTCTQEGAIGLGGTVTLPFACNLNGPIACPAGSLNQVYRAIPGWDAIANLADGVLGNEVESRAAFEERRKESVAKNAVGSIPAVHGAVLDVANVLDAYVIDNVADTNVTIRGAVLARKSIYVAVYGGAPADIARAIWTKKAPGCGYNGNTTITVTDRRTSYSPPYPTYDVTFMVPPPLPILFAVNLLNNAQVPADAQTQIQNAIMSAFAGGDGGIRARIGSTIMASRFYAPVAALGTWAQILSVQIGASNQSAAKITGSIAGNTLTVAAVASGALAVGQTLCDDNGSILAGTKIISGGGPNWTISKAQNFASATIYGVIPSTNSIAVNINQVPTISADNISVTLT